MEVRARPRSILDQTIEGRITDLFIFIQYKGKIIKFSADQ